MSKNKSALAALLLFSLGVAGPVEAAPRTAAEIRRKLDDPAGGLFVVAHRGCHKPAPLRGIASAPENSLAATDNCVAMGVDMVEVDIHRAKDGALVIMHDPSVDRTTDGTGDVADLTLAQIRKLRLRAGQGGLTSPMMTQLTAPTLGEFLAHAKGRIMVNLDVKGPIYAEVIAEVVKAGMVEEVLVKAEVDVDSAVLADQAPYAAAPFMPIIRSKERTPAALARMIERQASGTRRAPGVEIVFMSPDQLTAIQQAADAAKIRIWSNTLPGVTGLVTVGNDQDALRSADDVWGELIRRGVSIIQTDEPAALQDFAFSRGIP